MRTLRSSALSCLHPASWFIRGAVPSPTRPANHRLATQILHAPRPSQLHPSFILSCRYSSTAVSAPTNPRRPPDTIPKSRSEAEPAYEVTFTCKPCSHRSKHRMSKQGYHKGTVLITCPECKNRHVMSDHLRIFSDTSMTIEDLMRKKGQLVKKGTIGTDGDVEFWDDGSTTGSLTPEAKIEQQS